MMLLDLSPSAKRLNPITIPDAANLTPSGDFTIEFFDLTWSSTSTQVYYSHWNATGNQRSMIFQFNTATTLQASFSLNGSTSTSINHTFSPSIGTPYDICYDRSGSTVRVYIDGVFATSGTVSGALFNTTANVIIGADNSGGNAFGGTCRAIRYTPGVARYATGTSYTVPSLPLPTS